MKKRNAILLVLLLVVGFAAVSTSLIINGNIGIGANESNFDVIFTSATPEENGTATISEDGKQITYSTKKLSIVGDKAKLSYIIKNNSTQYDADTTVELVLSDNELNKYFKVEYYPKNKVLINAQSEYKEGYVEIELMEAYVGEDQEIEFTVNITANAVEREDAAEYIKEDSSTIKFLKNLGVYKGTDVENNINYSAISSDTNGKGLYMIDSTKNDDNPIFFYRGEVDNYLRYANFCWRIVRTTKTGGIKIVYNGTPDESGYCSTTIGDSTNTIISSSSFNPAYNSNAYVGYMYGETEVDDYARTHANTNNSTIKTVIDTWYEEHIKNTKYANMLEDTVWCNDRSIAENHDNLTSMSNISSYTDEGYNKKPTVYASYARVGYYSDVATPSLTCKNVNDQFTVNEVNGNGALTYPIAMLTVDEVAYAGGRAQVANPTYYLYNGKTTWTLSPGDVKSPGNAYVSFTSSSGLLSGALVNYKTGVRPAVSLSSSISIIDGDGTAINPFVVE